MPDKESEVNKRKNTQEIMTFPKGIGIAPEQYGDRFQQDLLEEYKLYVEMADQVSARRIQTNHFYISVISTLLGLNIVLLEANLFKSSFLTLVLCLLGIVLCITWYVNINSYKQLNSLKFQVIQEMESFLPFSCFAREWQILKLDSKRYHRMSNIEKYVPLIVASLQAILFLYVFLSPFKGPIQN